jgi:hypothetical protein
MMFKKFLLIIFLSILIVVLAIPIYTLFYNIYANIIITENNQGVTLTIIANDEYGKSIAGAHVILHLLSRDVKVLGESITGIDGKTLIHIIIPRTLITRDAHGRPIFASVNLVISAWIKEDKLAGFYAFPLDPTNMQWPEDARTIKITLKKIQNNTNNIKPQDNTPEACITYRETSSMTEVLNFATWDNIKAWYDYPAGAKIEIELKGRYTYDPCNDMSWISGGSAQVTLDSEVARDYAHSLTGEYVHSLFFKIYYATYGWFLPDFNIYEQLIYPIDTSTDPQVVSESSVSWSGILPAYEYYYDIPGGTMRGIPVTGGVHWEFSVSISFGVGAPPSLFASINLGVGKVDDPKAYLYILGEGSSYYYVRTVSSTSTFLRTYSNWL